MPPPLILNVMLGQGQGGLELMAKNYAAATAAVGARSVLLHGETSRSLSLPGVQLLSWPQLHQFDLAFVWRLRQWILANRPSLIISHGRRAQRAIGFAQWFLPRQARRPHIGVSHNYLLKSASGLSGLVVTTADLAKFYANKWPDLPQFALPNFIFETSLPRARHGYSLPLRPLRLGFIGRHVAKKGLDLLLEAIYLRKCQGHTVHLVVAGDGPMREAWQSLALQRGLADQVEWLGWLDNKAPFYDKVDCIVVPSCHEPFGLVYLEAWQAQKLLLATPTEGGGALLKHQVDAWVASSTTAEALAKAIEEIDAAGADCWSAMNTEAQQALACYTWPNCQQDFEHMLNYFVGSATNRSSP